MFIGVQFTLVIICTLVLWFHNVYSSALMTINRAFFRVVSMATTAGFTTGQHCPLAALFAGLLLCRVNGRWPESDRILLLFSEGNCELKRLVHPNAVYSIKLGIAHCRNVTEVLDFSPPMHWCYCQYAGDYRHGRG